MSISQKAEQMIYKRQNQKARISTVKTRRRGGLNIR
nr:MAG TPA: hypothetical protein [Microviridae sp.]